MATYNIKSPVKVMHNQRVNAGLKNLIHALTQLKNNALTAIINTQCCNRSTKSERSDLIILYQCKQVGSCEEPDSRGIGQWAWSIARHCVTIGRWCIANAARWTLRICSKPPVQWLEGHSQSTNLYRCSMLCEFFCCVYQTVACYLAEIYQTL